MLQRRHATQDSDTHRNEAQHKRKCYTIYGAIKPSVVV